MFDLHNQASMVRKNLEDFAAILSRSKGKKHDEKEQKTTNFYICSFRRNPSGFASHWQGRTQTRGVFDPGGD
jgi:hypothetical protein